MIVTIKSFLNHRWTVIESESESVCVDCVVGYILGYLDMYTGCS